MAPDFAVWLSAPRERTAEYFPTYSAISRAIQATLRQWVRDWFYAHLEVLRRYHTAYQIIVYFSAHPFRGRPTNIFTYDIQRPETVQCAFASAAYKLRKVLKTLNTRDLPWEIRERYFAYRYEEVIRYVIQNHRALYDMLNAETMLMNAVLRFAILDIASIGLQEGANAITKTFAVQLRRFSDEFDLSHGAGELLRVATERLRVAVSARQPGCAMQDMTIQ